MYLNPNYILRTLCDIPYLLPFGAGIAAFYHPLQLGGTGAFLWNALKQLDECGEKTKKELAVILAELTSEEYDLSAEELPRVEEEIEAFLSFLQGRGILTDERQRACEIETNSALLFPSLFLLDAEREHPALTIAIAGMKIDLYGDGQIFSRELFSFQCSDSGQIQFYFCLKPYSHPVPEGTLLIHHSDLHIFAFGDGYHLKLSSFQGIDRIFLTKDGSTAYFYLTGENSDSLRYDVFHAIRLVFSYSAMLRGYYLLHSVSLVYRDRAWLFSAPSGTGKSTHAALWMQLYEKEIQNLNGDLNLIAVKDGIPMVYGIPWNGTSGIYSTENVPLGGIVFLRQGEKDVFLELPEHQKRLFLLQRLISPNWTEELLNRHIHFADSLVPKIFSAELCCTIQPSAAELLKQNIDAYLTRGQ